MSETDAMVFVVDDDAPMRESLKNLIRSVGLRVELFASAQEFLRSKRPDRPSCLVLDVRLPGLSGLDLQRRTGDAGIEIPIVFITGHGDIPMSVRAMKAGAVEFLTKPFRALDLQRRTGDAGIEIPIVFITGHGDIPMSVRAMKAGAVEFLTKPFRDQDLLDAI